MYRPRHRRNAGSGEIGFFLLSLIVYALDQISKEAVVLRIGYRVSVPIIKDFFHLTYILNSGSSFGMLQNQTAFFIWVTGVVFVINCWAVFFWKGTNKTMRLLIGVITGGAMGNLTDRLRYGAVVDFIDFRGIWPYIFNLADMAVVCGGILLAIAIWMDSRDEIRTKPKH